MPEIQVLDWDTNFFGYKVGKISLTNNDIDDFFDFQKSDFDLIYLFSEFNINDNLLKKIGAKLQDIKIELIKDLDLKNNYLEQNGNVQLKEITKFSVELYHLVLESGAHSRFKLDKHFVNNEFDLLYKAWIQNSLNDTNAKVIGAYINNELLGFVSLSLKSGIADIGLIAVHEKARGNHIGKKLLESAYMYSIQNQSNYITVVTQEFNKQAMLFYLNNGFIINKKTFIYHLWKKSN